MMLIQVVKKNMMWPKGDDGNVTIPYKVPAGLSERKRAAIARAVLEYDQKTCIR